MGESEQERDLVLDRRRFIGLTAGAALLGTGAPVLLTNGAASAATRSDRARAVARSGGILNVAIPGDPAGLDPIRYNDSSILVVYTPVVESLYKINQHYKLVPVLADGLPKVNADATRYEVRLRPGIKFHNGKTLTSKDVKFSAEAIVNPKTASNNASFLAGLASVETPNDLTVVFNLAAPNRYYAQSAFLRMKIIPSNVPYNAGTYADKLIGTGPFKFASWVHGQRITLTANKHYWQRGLPYLSGVEYQIIPSQAGQITSLVNGAIQMIPNLPPNYAALVRSRGLRLYAPTTVPGIDWIWPNWSPGHPTSNTNLRLAMTYAINRKRIAEQVYKGVAKPESTIPASGSLGYSQTLGSAINPEGDIPAAKEYLSRAGGAPSSPLVFIATTAYEQAATECLYVQEDLASIGIKTTIEAQAASTAIGNLVSGNFDLWFLSVVVVTTPNEAALVDTPTSLLNYNHVNDPLLAALARNAANNAKVVPQVQRQMLKVVPQIPIVTYPPIYGLSKRVQGFVSTNGGDDLTGLVSTKLS